ncbi:MAG: hypothetical protein GY832_01475 [Chloroflexi bacterium]|nr:hypothetical protein [Chloroflexota bacterium]
MKVVELPAGTHRLGHITEPTCIRSVAEYPWDCILLPTEWMHHTISTYAPLRIEGCVITGGLCGIQTQEFVDLEVDNCWVVQNKTQGILSSGNTRIHHSLIERNGTNLQYHHGVYANQQNETRLSISNSIFRDNASLQVYYKGANTCLDQNVITGRRSIHGDVAAGVFRRNTIQGKLGRLPTLDDTNIIVEDANKELPYWYVHHNHLWWLVEGSKAWDGRGAYDYHDFGPDPRNQVAEAYAKTLWHYGWMAAVGGDWKGSGNMKHGYPHPHFPGDPMPVPIGG